MTNHRRDVVRDLTIIVFSIFVAIILARTGVLEGLIASSQEMRFIGSFIAGMFFVSVFTAAPATVALGELAQANSVVTVAVLGGLGALIGDLIIFRFVKDRVSQHIAYLARASKFRSITSIFKLKLFHWMIPFVGALIIASPLPDEIGVTMLGLSKMKNSYFILLSFFLNSAGILVIGLVSKTL